MSNAGLYGFEIPHEKAKLVRDMVLVRIPFPPRKSAGGIITPQQSRDIMAHNVMAGRIVAMGPVAFCYKDHTDKYAKHEVNIGDWVEFRPYAGTMVQGGTIMVTSGYRYISTFNDVIAILLAADMPDPATLEWDADEEPAAPVTPAPAGHFGGAPREKVVVPANKRN